MRGTTTILGRSHRACSDRELLAAWRGGDRGAGDRLVDRHFADVFGFFRSRRADAADDLTQQTFLQCLQSCGSFRSEASFRTYLFAIARNLLYADMRRRSRRGDVVCEVASLVDLGMSALEWLESSDDHELLVEALHQLPAELQLTLDLYYRQRLRGQQLIRVLGVPPGTVRSRIRRGIERLRAEMDDLATAARPVG